MAVNRLFLTLLVLVALLLTGTIGFHLLEEWSLFDSLYWTVITLSTIGYGDVVPKSDPGKVFTLFLVLTGVFTLGYAATELIRAVVSGEVARKWEKRQMERKIEQIRDHVIVCGYGRVGRLVCKEFSRENIPFVVIDRDPNSATGFHVPHGLALVGDATSDEILKKAGIDRARGLVTVMASDADNLYTTMSARLLSAKLFIVARVEDAQSEPKLSRAGANRVVSPYQIGGSRVVQAMLRPTVVDFIELATRTEHLELQLEETKVGPQSSLVGINLQNSRLRADLNVIIVAIKKSAGHMLFNPTTETIIEAGDILVAIGNRAHLDQLEALANRVKEN